MAKCFIIRDNHGDAIGMISIEIGVVMSVKVIGYYYISFEEIPQSQADTYREMNVLQDLCLASCTYIPILEDIVHQYHLYYGKDSE
jgi:hypothetical protein